MKDRELTRLGEDSLAAATGSSPPPTIVRAGDAARFAWEEFFYGRIRNPHTRRAYERAARRFLGWCDATDLPIERVTPAAVGKYFDSLRLAPPSKKLELAALRRLFDVLVLRHVIVLNPARSVRGERYDATEGRTPEILRDQARRLLGSIDVTTLVGLRDKAAISILVYTAARVGAVASLRGDGLVDVGDQYVLRLHEKRGKLREIPVRHDLERLLLRYLDRRWEGDRNLSLRRPEAAIFPTAAGRTGRLTERPMTAGDLGRMVRRRLRDAGLPMRLSAHSFRVATITDLLSQGVPLEDVQNLAGHADPRTTRLYDRRCRRVTRNIVERISI